MTFKCPQCYAEVTKENKDPLGCPCCGYAAAGVAPYFPPVLPISYPQPTLPPWSPYPGIPWIVGPSTGDPCPDCVKPSTTAPYLDSTWVGDVIPNPTKIISTGGTTWDPEQWKGMQVLYTN